MRDRGLFLAFTLLIALVWLGFNTESGKWWVFFLIAFFPVIGFYVQLNRRLQGELVVPMIGNRPSLSLLFISAFTLAFVVFNDGMELRSLYFWIWFSILDIIFHFIVKWSKPAGIVIQDNQLCFNHFWVANRLVDELSLVKLDSFSEKLTFHFHNQTSVVIVKTDYPEPDLHTLIRLLKGRRGNGLNLSDNLLLWLRPNT